MTDTSLMCDKNLFPRPAPSAAPFTSPAISTNSTVAGLIGGNSDIFSSSLVIAASLDRRSSGTGTIPTFGSIVAKG